MASIFSHIKTTFSATPSSTEDSTVITSIEQGRPSHTAQTRSLAFSKKPIRLFPLTAAPAQVAPPLVSHTQAQSEVTTYGFEYDQPPSRSGSFHSSTLDSGEVAPHETSTSGFPISNDPPGSVAAPSLQRSNSFSEAIRRIREKGLSQIYWVDDKDSRDCHDCGDVFTTWRRKHHCRICGKIFCSRCASNIISGTRFGQDVMLRVCTICLAKLADLDNGDIDDQHPIVPAVTSFSVKQLGSEPSVHLHTLDNPESTSSAEPVARLPDCASDNSHTYGKLGSHFDSKKELLQTAHPTSVTNMETGSRTHRREKPAHTQELDVTSTLYLKIMLRQMLKSEYIPNIKDWEETLLKLTLRAARELTFTILPHSQGEDMDVRKFVKVKKIPGGSPRDSEYVDGVVITKVPFHIQTAASIRDPRILLVSFPLEFPRVEGQRQNIQFSQIIRQQKEHSSNLTRRIASLHPHIVLAERAVSGLVQDGLASRKITVAQRVKPSVIQIVAHMTQADILPSMDRLTLKPNLGSCEHLYVQTYHHPLIPGRQKTCIRFEGCRRDLGCTIVLRGGDADTLLRVKKVMRFLTFVVRNLKLEAGLWKNSMITHPPFSPEALPPSTTEQRNPSNTAFSSFLAFPNSSASHPASSTAQVHDSHSGIIAINTATNSWDGDDENAALSKLIEQSIQPYAKTFISVSSNLRFTPPNPITRMRELDLELMKDKRTWEKEMVRREEHPQSTDTHSTEDIHTPTEALSSIVTSPHPVLKTSESSYFLQSPSTAISFSSADSMTSKSVPPTLEIQPGPIKTPADIAHESRYSLTKFKHEEQRRIWEWYLRKYPDNLLVENQQRISLREYTIPTAELGQRGPCFASRLNVITFYGENDCTLGQFIERTVDDQLSNLKAICIGKSCDKPLTHHCKVYVHNDTRLVVAVEPWDAYVNGRQNYFPAPDLFTTWSVCRVCGITTSFVPVSEEMQRYSFAKFLESYFYPADVTLVQGAECQHNVYIHHIRYFAIKDMTVRFQADPVSVHQIVYPPFRIRVNPEAQLELKNEVYNRLHQRNLMWYSALIDDLRLLEIDAATGDEEADARLNADINALIARAQGEREEICRLVNRIYQESLPTDTLALNQVHSYRQDRIVAWQHDFDRLPKPRPSQQTSSRSRKEASAFDSVQAAWPGFSSAISTSEAEHDPNFTVDTAFSSESEASESRTELGEPKVSGSAVGHDGESNPDSGSAVGASERNAMSVSPSLGEPRPGQLRLSRLPRRATHQPTVAELVRRYQDFLPPQGVHELADTALSPSGSMLEPITPRRRNRRRLPSQASTSDFEQSYAANIAPWYLPQTRKGLGTSRGRRISGSVSSSSQSQGSSRGSSREKRSSSRIRFSRSSSSTKMSDVKPPKSSISSQPKDKSSGRLVKPTLRRPPPGAGSKVSNIAKHFERIVRDTERPRTRYSVIRGRRARPVALARAKVEILESVKDINQDEFESSDSSSEDEVSASKPHLMDPLPSEIPTKSISSVTVLPDVANDLPIRIPAQNTGSANAPRAEPVALPSSPFLPPVETDQELTAPTFVEPSAGPERNSILKTISGFWFQQHLASHQAPEDDPEHIFRDSSMVVRTDEPTSMISLTLNSPQYRELLMRSRTKKRIVEEGKHINNEKDFVPDNCLATESTSMSGVGSVNDSNPAEDLKVPSSRLPWAMTFESEDLTIICTLLYPEQFDALRRVYKCEETIIESLSRCVKWKASSGKGPAFLKTRDDRFIAKELSNSGFHTMENFAPTYFDYMSSAFSEKRPTLLAKYFGCFKLTLKKNKESRKPTQMNLLIMENLFYDRRFTKIYDLKGSTRNRHVQSTGKDNEVLLDENLVQAAHLNPYYLHEHSQRMFLTALYNDSKFLADVNVMDYTMVVGVDSRKNELIVGIVDYTRTYTLDRKLEAWVKDSAFLGGRGEQTVVSPKQYRQRFLSAMERYFPLVPDRWMKQGKASEQNLNHLSEHWLDW